MFTIYYKGFYIHGYVDKPECKLDDGLRLRKFKTLDGAKRYVTKWLEESLSR